MTSHVEQQIAARIAAAKTKRMRQKRQRAELNEARQYGLEIRHSTKIKRGGRRG
ncbi:hypothetical protein AB0O67_24340 [Streptomyces sp. NPDC086077]|uniref:hypothetical protein n=1 Tax=Streptomyces sp. NPDC086077 TaxID=3154862 RepID=UPI003416CB02